MEQDSSTAIDGVREAHRARDSKFYPRSHDGTHASGLYRVNQCWSPERGARLARRERGSKFGICD